jgi:hypothetical protein
MAPGVQAALIAAADEATAGPFGTYVGVSSGYVLPISMQQIHPLVMFVHPRLEPLFKGEPDLLETLVPPECKRKVGRPRSGVRRLNADCKYFAKDWRRRKLGEQLQQKARRARAEAAAAAAAGAAAGWASSDIALKQQQEEVAAIGDSSRDGATGVKRKSSSSSDREARLRKRQRVSDCDNAPTEQPVNACIPACLCCRHGTRVMRP